jgi:hypothetical protein
LHVRIQRGQAGAVPLSDALAGTTGSVLAGPVEAVESATGGAVPLSDAVAGTTGVVEPVTGGALQLPDVLVGPAVAVEPVVGSAAPPPDVFSGGVSQPAEALGGPAASLAQTAPEAAPFTDATSASGSEAPWAAPLEALAGLPPEVVALSAGLATVAGLALMRTPGPVVAPLATARFFLANAPALPLRCAVGGGVRRFSSAALPAGFGHGGQSCPATGSLAGVGGVAGTAATGVDELGRAFRDGFLRGAGRAVTGDDESGGLMLQIGMLVGTVFLAVLTVWMWAARQRWTPQS